MERTGHTHRRSKSTSAFEGFPHIPKLRIGSRLSPDPRSYLNASIRDATSVEIGQSSVGRATDRPLANLRAERNYRESDPKRIHKETEPKRRSFSGIAKLLRREGLPSLWHAYKQKRRLLDGDQLNNTSINIEPNRQLYDGQSSRRSPKEQQELKDVYEDLETSSYVSARYSSRWSASSMLSKSDMALIRQNLESKRLTHDKTASEKLQESKELYGTSVTIDSRDISVQSGRQQKSLSPNPVYDLRGTSSSSLGCSTTLLNPPSSAKYGNAKSRIPNRDIAGKHKTTYHPNNDDGLPLDPHDCHRARTTHSLRTSDIQLKERNKKNTIPTPIFVLRPNQGDTQNGHGSSPYHSQSYSSNSRKVEEHPTVGCSKELSWRKTDSYYDAEFLKPGYEEARNLANKITRRLRDACDESEDTMYSGFRGDAEESDLNSDLEMFKWSSRSSFSDDNKRRSHPSFGSVSEGAKKRLAERWKITHRFRDLELVGKGGTLGEMLSTPDGEKRSQKTAHGRIDRTSRSRSVSPIGGRTHGRGTCHEKQLVHSEPISQGTSKVTKQYPSHRDHFSCQGSQFRGKKPLLCPPIYIEELDSSLEARFEIQMEANVKDVPYRQLSFQMEEKDDGSASDASETVATEHGSATLLPKTSLLHPNNSLVENEGSSSSSTAHDQKDFCLQELHHGASEEGTPSSSYLGVEQISLESSMGADYANPVSVLKIPSAEDASSSLERVSAELHDLQMQLQLLKMEVGAYDDREKDFAHSSYGAGSWEASYTLDVLMYAGLHDFGFNLFMIMWHTPDCPLDPRLFDNLEEKYCNEMAGTRPERLLLFDRINAALSEIFLKHVDLLLWTMPKLAGSIHVTWQKMRAIDTVEKLIHQEYANVLQVAERTLDRDMQWSDFTDEVALTGNDIEKLLLDDLLNELLFLVMVIIV